MPFIGIPDPQVGDPTYLQFALDVIGNLEFLNGQIGGGLGDDLIPNNSFEVDSNVDGTPDNWSVTSYTVGGGNFGINAVEGAHAAKSFFFSSTGGANGGGEIENDSFVSIQNLRPFYIRWAIKSTVATLSNKVIVKWYDRLYAPVVGTPQTVIYSNATTNLLDWAFVSRFASPPATARFFKLVLVGAEAGSGAGTVYFDHVSCRFLEAGNANLLVAAPDSPESMRARADMLCGPRATLNPAGSDWYTNIINEAIALAAASGGGRVYLAEGTYYIGKNTVGGAADSEINLVSNVTLHGFGRKTRLIWNDAQHNQDGEQMIFANAATRTGVFDLFVDGSTEIESTGALVGWTERSGVVFLNCTDSEIRSVHGAGFQGNKGLPPGTPAKFGAAIKLDTCTRVSIQNCEASNVRGFGIWLKACIKCEVIESVIRNGEMAGIGIEGGEGAIIRGNVVSSNSSTNDGQDQGGIYVFGGAKLAMISGNYVDSNGWFGINLADASNCVVASNVAAYNSAIAGGPAGINIGATSSYNVIAANKLLGNVTTNILCYGTYNQITGNQINGHNAAGVTASDVGINVASAQGSFNWIMNNHVTHHLSSSFTTNGDSTTLRKERLTFGAAFDDTMFTQSGAGLSTEKTLVPNVSGSATWLIIASCEVAGDASTATGYGVINMLSNVGIDDNVFYYSGGGDRTFTAFKYHTGNPPNVNFQLSPNVGQGHIRRCRAVWLPVIGPQANDPWN